VLAPGTADVPLATVADVLALLAATVNQVRRGELDAKVGNCIGCLSGIALRAIEGNELADELADLRRQVEELRRGDGNLARAAS
jgi:hypothetical protein